MRQDPAPHSGRLPSSLGHGPLHHDPVCPRNEAEARAPSHHRPGPGRHPRSQPGSLKHREPGAPRCRSRCRPLSAVRAGRVAMESGRGCSGSRRDDGGRLGSIRAGSGGRQGAAKGRAGTGRGTGSGAGRGRGQAGSGEHGGVKEAVRASQGCREEIEIKGRWDVEGGQCGDCWMARDHRLQQAGGCSLRDAVTP